ncbi:MAG TPA: hypothetical protein VIC85_05620 [Ktedonobacterales bacterium]
MLGAAAKVAVATTAAGVLVEQVTTLPAFADNLGVFSSSVGGTPAFSATGTSGADGVDATSDSGSGVSGQSGSGCGVAASSTSGTGVFGSSTSGNGVQASSTSGTGIFASTGGSGPNVAVYGTNTSNDSNGIAIFGHSDDGTNNPGPGTGVRGETAGGTGVVGSATTGTGVSGTATSGVGVVASSATGDAVQATGGGGYGIVATSIGGASRQAVYGAGTSGAAGLRATSDSGNGITASSGSGTGLNVQSSTGSAVIATSSGVGCGLYLTATSGCAIGCVGRIRVLGNAVGTVTPTHGTTSKVVSSTACSGSSQVILTATSDPRVRTWAVAPPRLLHPPRQQCPGERRDVQLPAHQLRRQTRSWGCSRTCGGLSPGRDPAAGHFRRAHEPPI